MARDPNNLGGAKPRMRAGSRDLLVSYGTARKAGYYELCPQGQVIYRRVELPPWISDVLRDPQRREPLLTLLKERKVRIPPVASNERQGHVWFNPEGFINPPEPCVGVDTEIVQDYLLNHRERRLVFVCYEFGKIEAERWRIDGAKFLDKATWIKPREIFEPQYFIPISALER